MRDGSDPARGVLTQPVAGPGGGGLVMGVGDRPGCQSNFVKFWPDFDEKTGLTNGGA